MVLMDLTGIFLCILTMYLTCKPAWAYSLVQVPDCPSSKPDWDKHANNYKANCTNGITYHCLLSVQGELHEGCMRYILINATAKGDCPQVRGVSGDFAFEGGNFNCTEDATVCPKIGSSYRSDELYKYPGCFGNRSVIQTTEKTTEKATEQILKDTTYSTTNIPESGLSTVAKFGIVFGVTVLITGILIGLGIIGCFVWRGRTGRIRNQTSASGKPSNGAAQYSVVSQSEPPIMSNGSPLSGQDCAGGKRSKERITVALCSSVTGEKLPPLIIGKDENPRCFSKINKAALPVKYYSNRKAWMTRQIFNDWITGVNRKMKRKNRRILLFIDNASSHEDLDLSHVKVKFSPPNTTSHTQRMDQGIIQAAKLKFCKKQLLHMIKMMDHYG